MSPYDATRSRARKKFAAHFTFTVLRTLSQQAAPHKVLLVLAQRESCTQGKSAALQAHRPYTRDVFVVTGRGHNGRPSKGE